MTQVQNNLGKVPIAVHINGLPLPAEYQERMGILAEAHYSDFTHAIMVNLRVPGWDDYVEHRADVTNAPPLSKAIASWIKIGREHETN